MGGDHLNEETGVFFSEAFRQLIELRVLTDALYETLDEPRRMRVKMHINALIKNDLYLGQLSASSGFDPEDIRELLRELVANLA